MPKTATERQREKRKRDTDVTKNVTCHETNVTPENEVSVKELFKPIPASLEQYQTHPDMYIPRSEPDKLNWGPWMSSDELGRAGLKANRVSIPGDWDYE